MVRFDSLFDLELYFFMASFKKYWYSSFMLALYLGLMSLNERNEGTAELRKAEVLLTRLNADSCSNRSTAPSIFDWIGWGWSARTFMSSNAIA